MASCSQKASLLVKRPLVSELWQMKNWQTKKAQKSRQNAYTTHARGHLLILLFRLSFRVELTVCSNFLLQTSGFPSLPFQMPGVRPDWQCLGERLSAQIDFFAP